MDDKGYVMSLLSFLLIIPAISLAVVFLEMVHTGGESTGLFIGSDVTFYTAKDVERNIPILGRHVLRETADNVVQTGDAISDSRTTAKSSLQARMNQLTQIYQNNTGANIKCMILSVDSSSDPFMVEINSTIYVQKYKIAHNETISQEISIIDSECPMPDPLPFIKCKNYGGVTNNSNRILYGSSLANLLNAKGMLNSTVYENASSSLFIKKCPYDPYIQHGGDIDYIMLKNCIDNGYFHESSDGACFLCRLEGKATCSHYGFETFIVPSETVNSTLQDILAPCSIDHVLYNDSSYHGRGITYYSWNNGSAWHYFNLYFDNGHRQKYGLPTY